MKAILQLLLFIGGCSNFNPLVNDKLVDMSDPTNTLTGKQETLQLSYIVFGCACANWITPTDYTKYKNDSLPEHCIFIEPASKDLELPAYFEASRHFIKVTGQFYVRPDYPKGTFESEEQLDKAKVFRYTKVDVFKKDIHYSPKDDTTLQLNYSAISCTCAQWSDNKAVTDSTKEYYYLEPANNKLINANTLWDGNHLPLQIQVTGQVVSYAGLPTGFNPAKGAERGIVFRYTKLKVLKYGH